MYNMETACARSYKCDFTAYIYLHDLYTLITYCSYFCLNFKFLYKGTIILNKSENHIFCEKTRTITSKSSKADLIKNNIYRIDK